MKRFILLIAVLGTLAAACGDSGSETTLATDAVAINGQATTTVTETAPAETTTTAAADDRIITLTGDLTEIVFALGRGDSVVGVDVTTTFPPEATDLPQVGFGQMLAAEPVLAFEPTLVIGDQTIQPPEALDQLRDAGVEVVIIDSPPTLDGVLQKITTVAELLGVPEEGATLAAEVAADIEAATTLAAGAETAPRVVYIYVRGPETIFLFGAGMPTQAMIEGAKAVDVGAELLGGPAPLTPEALVAAAPDVIVLPEAGLAALGGIEAFEQIPGVADTPAADTDRYLIYDEAYFFNLGPRVGKALLEFVKDLYPNLAQ